MSEPDPPNPGSFALRLRRLRAAAGLTQVQLAARSGLSARGVSDLERGLRAPRATTVSRLAAGLDVPTTDLEQQPDPFRSQADERAIHPLDSILPTPVTALVGRDDVIRRIHTLLDESGVRLVTITGAGGVGKTRVALEVAHARRERYAEGAVFVDLAPVSDPHLVLPTMARALAVQGVAGREHLDRLIRALANREVLVVLDNAEHVHDALTDLPALLAHCPSLTILATSREHLRVSGEHECQLRPLAVPDHSETPSLDALAGFDAMRLFVQRARAVAPNFTLTDENVQAVADICRRMDGLPLAIELAAARTRVLPPPALLERLGVMLPLLSGGGRDLPERQQAMRNTITWSYDLLSPGEQRSFRLLAVFTGGFTLDAFEAICDACACPSQEPFDVLSSLVDKHLVHLRDADQATPRYGLLEPIREFGREALAASGEEHAARRAHADWCMAFVKTVVPRLRPILRPEPLARVEAEHANLRAALTWLDRHGQASELERMASGLGWFWYLSGRWHEGLAWLRRALDHAPDEPTPEHIQALISAGHLGLVVRDPAARSRLDRALVLARATGDARREVKAVILLGIMASYGGDVHHAESRFEEAKVLLANLDEPWDPVVVDFHLGALAFIRGRWDEAVQRLEATAAAARAIGDMLIPTWCTHFLAQIACQQGDTTRAASLLHDARQPSFTGGINQSYPQYLSTAAMLADALGEHRSAARLMGAAAIAINDLPFPSPVQVVYDRTETTARDRLGNDVFEELWHAGRRMRRAEIESEIAQLLAAADRHHGDGNVSLLTPREQEVLRLLIDGRSNPEIAITLFISTHTAARHVTNILGKFNVESRAAAVAYAFRHNLV